MDWEIIRESADIDRSDNKILASLRPFQPGNSTQIVTFVRGLELAFLLQLRIPQLDGKQKLLVIPEDANRISVGKLLNDFEKNKFGIPLPEWAAVQRADHKEVVDLLLEKGATKNGSFDSVTKDGKKVTFVVFRLTGVFGSQGKLSPISEKIGEGSENLKRRADWFKKRTQKSS